MLDRVVEGDVPAKPHTALRSDDGVLRYEECFTRHGFEGAFSILYHLHRPHEAEPAPLPRHFPAPRAAADRPLARRHYRTLELPELGSSPLESRLPLLFNDDVVIGFVRPRAQDTSYFVNADADELFYVHQGGGTLRSPFGNLVFRGGDYVVVPRGTLHRFVPDPELPQAWLSIECKNDVGIPAHYRNAVGQLRMDAPYSHRDFRRPVLAQPGDDGIRSIVVKRNDAFHGMRTRHSPLDVVGWDGTVYPFAFPILAFQPRVGQVHLPPTVHATFEAGGALVCSFVPRPLDFHESAIPCPYPHSSVHIDEVLFYANATFGSRRGIVAGSLSHHPAGIPHGPHPGAYESSAGQTQTTELAVMLDCAHRLESTENALTVEDPEYHASFQSE
ncbi:MAG TPA: homogentisate 1,2-dioxygenase [Polyangiaceae bacterium]